MTAAAVGVDVGGTFTDAVAAMPDGSVRARKVPTTPRDQSQAVAEGVGAAGGDERVDAVAHGTTTATNAVLERRLARTVLVTTEGFRDVLAIGRQDRPSLYDLAVTRPDPLVSREQVVTVRERLAADGADLLGFTDEEVERVAAAVADQQPHAVAISLLFGYLDPAHEQRLADALARRLGDEVPLTVASTLLPEFREYERASTCVLNAAIAPVMRRYLQRLAAALGDATVTVMTSGGGTAALEFVADRPVHTLLSGPAAGVVAAAAVAEQAGHRDALAFDMGGTSTDVCLIRDGQPQRRTDADIDGLPFRTPAVAVHTVGAGGGSVAWVDAGGALRVGPRSAGAEPGPACYSRGGKEPTVTDAHAAAGHLTGSGEFASGALKLDAAAAEAALARLPRDVAGPAGPAAGVLTVVRATMARALRRVSTEQGVDPGGLALVAYGGAGPLHACALARELGCPTVVVPPAPGVLSALGLLLAPPRAEESQTVMVTLPAGGETAEAEGLWRVWRKLADAAVTTLQGTRGPERPAVTWLADLRYAGQSHELRVEVDESAGEEALREALHRAHADLYGYRLEDADVEAVTLRAAAEGRAVLAGPPPSWDLGELEVPDRHEAPIRLADGTSRPAAVVHRAALQCGEQLDGPALVHQPDATTLVEAGDRLRVAPDGSLLVTIEAADG